MRLESIREKLGITTPFLERKDGVWLHKQELDVRQMAAYFVENGARLITIVAQPIHNGEFRILYHWDLDGKATHLSTETYGGQIMSITSTCPAADWIEREIHDYYGILFTHRDSLPPLILRSADPPGLFYWKSQKTEMQ